MNLVVCNINSKLISYQTSVMSLTESRWPKQAPIPAASGEGGQGSAVDYSTSTAGISVMEICTDVANLDATPKEIVDMTRQMADEARRLPEVADEARRLPEVQNSARDSDKKVFPSEHVPSPDPAIVAVGPTILNTTRYFNETPLSKVSKAMMALPDVERNVTPIINETPMTNVSEAMLALPDLERNVAPIIATEEDDRGMLQERPSLYPAGPEASEGYSSAFAGLQDLLHQHQQPGIELSEVIQNLVKSMIVPSATEVSPCGTREEGLPSSATGTSSDGEGTLTGMQGSGQRSKPDTALPQSDMQLCPSRPDQSSRLAGVDSVDVNGNSGESVSTEAMQNIAGHDSDQSPSASTHYVSTVVYLICSTSS